MLPNTTMTNTSIASSYMNSPEKQSGSRWSVPRDERRKILEQMERARDDQKRRKKKDWCRLERKGNEFDEAWDDETLKTGLKERDMEIMRIDEGIVPVKEPEIKRLRITPDTQEAARNGRITPQFHLEHEFVVVDFDCVESLLISISRSNSDLANSSKFVLNVADEIYKSDLLFYKELRYFDQPSFMYYAQEDDLKPLKFYDFDDDDLGRFYRMKSFKDHSRKFYRERAYRHRYISWKPYNLFFTDLGTFRQLRFEIENLDKKCTEFHVLMGEIFAKRETILISGNPLLKAFSLLLVISRTIERSTKELSNMIWSHSKYGTEWTLKEALNRSGNPLFLTGQRNSKLATEAERFRLKFININKNKE